MVMLMFKVTLTLTAAFLLITGQIIEKSEQQVLDRGYATIEKCRNGLRNDNDVYRAIQRSTDELRELAESSNRTLVRIGIRAFCLRQPS
jgi:hypothetical protein